MSSRILPPTEMIPVRACVTVSRLDLQTLTVNLAASSRASIVAGSATVSLVAATPPSQIQADCAADINHGERDPALLFALYGYSDLGVGTSVEFVTVPDNGKLYQAKSSNGTDVSMDPPNNIYSRHNLRYV